MTLAEYYGLPEGTNATMKYTSYFDTVSSDFPCPSDMSNAFSNEKRTVLKEIDVSNVTNMDNMFYYCSNLTVIAGIENWDTSNVTTMDAIFNGCENLTEFDLSNWNTSKLTNMKSMFYNCKKLTSLDFSNLDTSKVTNMNDITNSSVLTSFGAINCGGLTSKNNYPLGYYSINTGLTYLGGFIDAKMSWDENYGLAQLPNLTYESCINVLNGLYDFASAGEIPNSSQGKLKVHKNFLTLVGDEISIGTGKGWVITS